MVPDCRRHIAIQACRCIRVNLRKFHSSSLPTCCVSGTSYASCFSSGLHTFDHLMECKFLVDGSFSEPRQMFHSLPQGLPVIQATSAEVYLRWWPGVWIRIEVHFSSLQMLDGSRNWDPRRESPGSPSERNLQVRKLRNEVTFHANLSQCPLTQFSSAPSHRSSS
jgi:hypothetical protein